MDFPKSMPDIGLVNGRFVDEDITTGQIGSYIPSSWGNAVTQEILNVIEDAELTPDEGDNTQLLVAISKIAFRSQTVLRYVSSSKTLVSADLGLVLIDAGLATVNVTLPASTPALGVRDVILRRTDNTGNRLKVLTSADDKIKLHTHLNSVGYPFLVLMGAGDWWHLRSDGAGSWWPVGRSDATPLGRVVFDTSTVFSPGGYGSVSGAVFDRVDWPWLWDHAQQSGMLTTEAGRIGNEGGWTSGDGVLTFRGPEGRGEFFRVLDEGRGADPDRVAGSWQKGSVISFDPTVAITAVVALHTTGTDATARSDVGLDIPDTTNYTKVNSGVVAADGTVYANSLGVARPRNIAYPGRIKLI